MWIIYCMFNLPESGMPISYNESNSNSHMLNFTKSKFPYSINHFFVGERWTKRGTWKVRRWVEEFCWRERADCRAESAVRCRSSVIDSCHGFFSIDGLVTSVAAAPPDCGVGDDRLSSTSSAIVLTLLLQVVWTNPPIL